MSDDNSTDGSDKWHDRGDGLAVALIDNGTESSLLVEYESEGEVREAAYSFPTDTLRGAVERYLDTDAEQEVDDNERYVHRCNE